MSDHESPAAVVRAIAADIGARFGVTSAERGRRVAERLYSECDEETILAILADGCAVHLRKEHTDVRRLTQDAIARAARSDEPEESAVQIPLLDYPITLPGEQTMRLGDATKADIRAALRAISSQRRGIDRTEQQLQRFIDALETAADFITVDALIASGAVDIAELFGDEMVA